MIENVFKTKENAPVVYVMYGYDDTVLYVGKTVNFHTRWSMHKTNPNSVINVDKVKDIILYVMDSEPSCLFLEAQMILLLKPLWNKAIPYDEPSKHTIEPLLVISYADILKKKDEQRQSTIVERRELLATVDRKKENGLTAKEACLSVGISYKEYQTYKMYLKRSEYA